MKALFRTVGRRFARFQNSVKFAQKDQNLLGFERILGGQENSAADGKGWKRINSDTLGMNKVAYTGTPGRLADLVSGAGRRQQIRFLEKLQARGPGEHEGCVRED
jgi:hypothetical protein